MGIYKERQTFKTLIYLMIIPIIAIAISTSALPFTFNFILLLFFALLLYNFFYLDILITKEVVEFGFGIFKTKLDRKEILSCEQINIRFGNYLGMGIRYGFDGTKAYNTRFGKAVRIKAKDKKREFVVTTNNPEKICSILKK